MAKHPRKGKLSDREIVIKHREAEKLKAKLKTINDAIEAIKSEIIDEFETRGTKAIEHDGERLTYVQTTTVTYDEAGLLEELTPKVKRMVFTENIDLNGLPDAVRKKLIATVPKRERAAVTTISLDKTALSQAMQAGEIDPEVVDSYSSVRANKPYIRSSSI